jgi:hypothetical protein
VTRDAAYWNSRDLFGRRRIDDAEIPVTLVRHEQHGSRLNCGAHLSVRLK